MGNGRIWASVGRNGKNIRSDVLVVQGLLMDCIGTYGPLLPFRPDGMCGPRTIETITQFQRNALRMPIPDGRVDPGGATLTLLNARAVPSPPPDGAGETQTAPPDTSPGPPPALPAGSPAVNLSDAGLNFIARHEGLVLHLYNDAAFLATIGYGHLVHRARAGTNPTAEAPYKGGITKGQALAMLRQDAAIHVANVQSAVRVPLAQYQFDALVSLSFNIGGGALRSSTLVRIINQDRPTPSQIRTAFCMWNKAANKPNEGLLLRRNDEATLFNDNRY